MDDIAEMEGVDQTQRAGRGAFAVVAYARACQHDLTADLSEDSPYGEELYDEPETMVVDLLADLMHLADQLDLDFDYMLGSAYRHHNAETPAEVIEGEVIEPLPAIEPALELEAPVYDHDARPDDLPEPGNRCKDCGQYIFWVGGYGANEWEHTD